LDRCFSGYPMKYIIEENEKVIILKREGTSLIKAKIPDKIVIQQLPVQGSILDTTGTPLIGVSVSLKGQASVGTSTDLNGRYVLDVPENGVLVFSMIGFETQEVPVNGRTQIDIVLEVSTSQ